MAVRILLADDHEVMREGLHALLFRDGNFDVVANAANGDQAVAEAQRCMPDVVIMDINMPGKNGIEAAREILDLLPDIKILCLSMHRNSMCVRAAFEAGASGYLLKDCAVAEIATAIHTIMKGEKYLGDGLAALLDDMNGGNE